MTRTARSVALATLLLALGGGAAHAVPTTFTFTGRLLDGDAPLDGDVTMDLAIYDTSNGGMPVWAETQTTTADSGLISVAMGSEVALDPADFGGGDLWLEVTVNSTVLTPRYQFRSVPYAIRAGMAEDSEAVGGIPADQVQQVLDSSCTVGNAIRNIAPDGTVTCEPVVSGGSGVPMGAIMFFDVDCPSGWSAYDQMNGRVAVGAAAANIGDQVGTPLISGGTRTITDVPQHHHSVDPPSTSTSTHTGDTPSMTSSGAHAHAFEMYANLSSASAAVGAHGGENAITPDGVTSTDGAHVHTMNQLPDHNHTVDIASFNSSDTGVTAVDVTMPYLQLRACRKD
ncbi:MAG TPA: hypothetical protein VL172_06955 [Kofleriaceae bacterium]|nr:hypothetical protein [Kofleriaceae bacterium]